MIEYIGAVGGFLCADAGIAREMQGTRPGGIIRINYPNDIQWLPPFLQGGRVDCYGCGAPLKSYTSHCEYCRRAK